MSLRRFSLFFGLFLLWSGVSGCTLKVALDSPSEPLERVVHDVDRVAEATGRTADSIQTVAHEVREARAAMPDLGSIYNHLAQVADKDRNPVIVIPGILGSRLVDDPSREIVWGEFSDQAIDPNTERGAKLFSLPMNPGQPLDDLHSNVRVDGTLSELKVKILGIPFQIDAYREILTALGVGGYADPDHKLHQVNYGKGHFTCFEFAYDWRRDNAENARRLHEFILEKKSYVEGERIKRYGTSEPVRFDLVAHSMGGLLARYYLMYGPAELPADGTPPVLTWSGAQHVDRLVQVGPPNAGSARALLDLVQGVKFSKLLPEYDAALWGTMPAAYQLLPRTRHAVVRQEGSQDAVDLLDPVVWERHGWGLLDPKQDGVLKKLLPHVREAKQRRLIAAEHLQKCLRLAKSFQAAVDVSATPPNGTSIHLIAGDAFPTVSQLLVTPDGSLEPSQHAPGDTSVTRSSALMDERLADAARQSERLVSPVRFDSVTFLLTDHRGLTSDPSFTDNVLYLLLEAPR